MPTSEKPSKQDIQDLYFMDTRYKLLDLAAYFDRLDRHKGTADFRQPALLEALQAMQNPPAGQSRTQAVHLALSDHSSEPLDKAPSPPIAYGAVKNTA